MVKGETWKSMLYIDWIEKKIVRFYGNYIFSVSTQQKVWKIFLFTILKSNLVAKHTEIFISFP